MSSYSERIRKFGQEWSESPDLATKLLLFRKSLPSSPTRNDYSRDRKVRRLKMSIFMVYGVNYSVPSLLPFTCMAFPPSHRKTLLLYMLTSMTSGDVFGRT